MKIIFSEGSGLNDSIYGKCQAPIRMFLEQRGEQFERQSVLKDLFLMGKSENYGDLMTTMTAMSGFEPVGENGAYPLDGMQEGYQKLLVYDTWKDSFSISAEMMEDSKVMDMKKQPAAFITSYNRTREKFAAQLLFGGTGATTVINGKTYDTTSADGVSLFNQNHPSKTKGTKLQQSNAFKAAFSTSIFDQVQERMQGFMDDDGNLLNLAPDTIIIPNDGAMKRAIFAMAGSDFDPSTANNAINFQVGLWNVIVWNYLPKQIGTKPYFMMMDSKFKDDYECLPWLDRVPLTVRSDIDPNTDANVFKGRARFGAGFFNWRCIAVCGEGVTGTALTV